MNNSNPFFNPFFNYQQFELNQENMDKIYNKLERIEKNIRILENRINILEKKETNNNLIHDEPTDMYMI